MRWLRRLFGRPSPSDAARILSRSQHEVNKARIRAKCDEMRREMGMEPARWPE